MGAILAMAFKDLRLLFRDRAGFFFTFFFPLMYAIFFGNVFSGAGNAGRMKVALVDQDDSAPSRALVASLRDSDEFDAVVAPLDKARDMVRKGRRVAYILVPKGYGERAGLGLFTPGEKKTRLVVGLDPSRKAEGGMLQGILAREVFSALPRAFQNKDMRRRIADDLERAMDSAREDAGMPANVRKFMIENLPAVEKFWRDMPDSDKTDAKDAKDNASDTDSNADLMGSLVDMREETTARRGPRSSFEITFPQGIIWGIMGCAAAFGVSLVVERSRGTLLRLRVAPIARTQILAGKAVACFVAISGVAASIFGIGMLVPQFNLHPDSLGLLVVAIASVGACFVGLMMFLSVLGRTERAAGGIGWAVMMVMAMFGGGMLPLFIMPPWMAAAGDFSPVKWSILAMEGAVWRGFTPAEMATPCGILVGTGAVFFLLGARLFRFTDGG